MLETKLRGRVIVHESAEGTRPSTTSPAPIIGASDGRAETRSVPTRLGNVNRRHTGSADLGAPSRQGAPSTSIGPGPACPAFREPDMVNRARWAGGGQYRERRKDSVRVDARRPRRPGWVTLALGGGGPDDTPMCWPTPVGRRCIGLSAGRIQRPKLLDRRDGESDCSCRMCRARNGRQRGICPRVEPGKT